MKHRTFFILLTLFFGLASLTACGGQEEAAQTETEVTAEDVQEESTEAMETAAAYTEAQKEEYMQQINTRLEAMGREIEALEKKIQAGTTEIKAESQAKLNDALATLRTQKAAAENQYEELEAASGEAWSDIKTGMYAAMQDMKVAFEEARSEFQ